jgi:general stress protein 26
MTDHDRRTLTEATDGVRFAMVVTAEADGMRSRPLTVQRIHGSTVWFLVDAGAPWLPADGDAVHATFVADDLWSSVTGPAMVVRDPQLIEELGDPVSDTWFQEGAAPAALRIDAEHGDWWTSSGAIRGAIEMVRAKVAGSEPDIGERGTVEV